MACEMCELCELSINKDRNRVVQRNLTNIVTKVTNCGNPVRYC